MIDPNFIEINEIKGFVTFLQSVSILYDKATVHSLHQTSFTKTKATRLQKQTYKQGQGKSLMSLPPYVLQAKCSDAAFSLQGKREKLNR